jgi:hypothetical protein
MKKIFIFKSTLISTLFITIFSLNIYSHEGHDNAPGSLKSLHGGTVQAGKQINLEVIISGNMVTIFPISHDGKDIPVKNLSITSTAKPKKGKPYPVTFSPTKEGLTATVDLKGKNRVPVEISVSEKGKTDRFIIQVEE